MGVLIRFISLIALIQIKIQEISADINHLTIEDSKCFPSDFRFQYDEQEFVRLLIIPYLDKKSLSDLGRLDLISVNNPRYNDFLSCMWKNREFQIYNGNIDFDAIQKALAATIGREVGDTGPGINLSNIEATKIVDKCKNLGGYSHGQKVVLVRNCILRKIKEFLKM